MTDDKILFLKIGYNPKNDKVFTKFYNEFSQKICYYNLLNKKIYCDICIFVEGIFCNSKQEVFLTCSLKESTVVLKKENRILISREGEKEEVSCRECGFYNK